MPPRKRRRNHRRIHDAIFKTFFADRTVAKNYLLHYAGEHIHQYVDFSHFRKCDTAFVSGRFGVSFSDVVYETRLPTGARARVLFLWEHKSFLPQYPIHLQLMDYLLQIWEDDMKNKQPLSFIIPIVVYHGPQGWEQNPLSDFFKDIPPAWKPFVPDFEYVLTNLGKMSFKTIQENRKAEYLRNLFMALKASQEVVSVKIIWKEILTFEGETGNDDRTKILFQALILYLYNLYHMSKEKVIELTRELPDNEKTWPDSIPEVLWRRWKRETLREEKKNARQEGREEGRQEGREEGRQEGREEGRQEMLHAFISKTLVKFPEWTDAEVADLTNATLEEVAQIRAELKTSLH